ncbi:MAG: RNase adapter RapZ [Gammaproteobacteria bacterium]|nr:RNase adapter RapZ [Gammaproteobacteria bacterium]
MRLIIVSGLSGSGKTVALRTLEDAGFYSIDNLPLGMLPELVDNMVNSAAQSFEQVAVAVDARSGIRGSAHFDAVMARIARFGIRPEVLFLTCEPGRLLQRFSETRRRHPLSREGLPLADAIREEKAMLDEIHANADLSIDSSNLNVHELRQNIISRLLDQSSAEMGILVQSFGFKNGIPGDTDFVFDVRCLPNPHWEEKLRSQTGLDPEVAAYLANYPEVDAMLQSITHFLGEWIPRFEQENRSYMTISLGCTGGKHRSVYLVQRIADALATGRDKLSVRHRDLE